MTDSEADRDLERLEQLVSTQADSVPPEVAQRLAAMRRAAVERLDRKSATPLWLERLRPKRDLAYAGALLSVVLSAWLVLRSGGEPVEIPLVAEPEVVLVQDLELLEELEFLAWLEEESQGAG